MMIFKFKKTGEDFFGSVQYFGIYGDYKLVVEVKKDISEHEERLKEVLLHAVYNQIQVEVEL